MFDFRPETPPRPADPLTSNRRKSPESHRKYPSLLIPEAHLTSSWWVYSDHQMETKQRNSDRTTARPLSITRHFVCTRRHPVCQHPPPTLILFLFILLVVFSIFVVIVDVVAPAVHKLEGNFSTKTMRPRLGQASRQMSIWRRQHIVASRPLVWLAGKKRRRQLNLRPSFSSSSS